MRLIFMGNNYVGYKTLEYLAGRDEQLLAVVLHPPNEQRYGVELLRLASDLPGTELLSARDLRDEEVLDRLRSQKPEVGVSSFFGHILRSDVLELFPRGIFNLHPSLLPFNRGSNPNVWSIVERTPAGASIHLMDEGIDTGAVVAQRSVEVLPVDTGESLYRRLEEACIELFRETWPRIRSGEVSPKEQDPRSGTIHRTADLARIDHIDLDRDYRARDLIDVIRARTFPPYPGAYFDSGGRKVYLELKLRYAEESATDEDR